MRFTIASMIVASALLGGCATPSVAVGDSSVAPESAPATLASDYKLGVGDKIRVIVFNEETMSGEFQVNAGGKVSLPLIGDVDATGHTTSEVANAVRTGLAAGYLRDPRVNVEVLSYRPYFILGEIKTPAQYPYVNGMTVTNAIATAGGFTARASRGKVFIRRSGEDQEKVYDLSPDLRVYPGDTIRLGERYF